VYKGQAQKWFL